MWQLRATPGLIGGLLMWMGRSPGETGLHQFNPVFTVGEKPYRNGPVAAPFAILRALFLQMIQSMAVYGL